MIMVRILHLETFLKCFSLKEDVDFYVQVIDSFLEENHHIFHIVGDALNGVTVVGRCETPEHPAEQFLLENSQISCLAIPPKKIGISKKN